MTGADLAQALAHARAGARQDGAETLHALPVQITLDGGQPLRDPRGLIGRRLALVVHLVQVAAAPLYNLVAAVERCHLDIAGVVAAPYAAGIASLSEDEMGLGALVLDLGGGVTGVARFADGRLQDIHSVPLGGRHVTQDLAFGLSTGWPQAERLKTLYGSVLSRAGDAHQRLEVPGLGDPDNPPLQIVSRARLTEIMRPRVEEIFQLVRTRLEGERGAAGRPQAGADRRRQHARGCGRARRGDLRHARPRRPHARRLTGRSTSPGCRAARPPQDCCAGPTRTMGA